MACARLLAGLVAVTALLGADIAATAQEDTGSGSGLAPPSQGPGPRVITRAGSIFFSLPDQDKAVHVVYGDAGDATPQKLATTEELANVSAVLSAALDGASQQLNTQISLVFGRVTTLTSDVDAKFATAKADTTAEIAAGLANHYTKAEVDNLEASLTSSINAKADQSSVFTKAETSTLVSGVQSSVNTLVSDLAAARGQITATNNRVNALTTSVNGKASQSALNTLTTTVNGKASQASFNAVQSMLNAVIAASSMSSLVLKLPAGLEFFLDAKDTKSFSTGSRTWNDVSGNNRNFVARGNGIPSHNGQAVNLNRNADLYFTRDDCTFLARGAAERTVITIAKKTQRGDRIDHVFHYGRNSCGQAFGLVNRVNAAIGDHSWCSEASSTSWPLNQRATAGVTYKGRRYYYLKNGGEATGRGITLNTIPETADNRCNIGARIFNAERFGGQIGAVLFWNRALSPAESKAVHDLLAPRYTF